MSDPNSATEHTNASTAEEELIFNTDLDAEAELEELQRSVQGAQEELQLQKLLNAAAKDEGQRKQVLPAGQTAGAGTSAVASATGTAGSSSGINAAGSPAGAATANRITSVFIGGMDPHTSEADLRLFLSSCGTIKRITILKDRTTGQPKGTAYVEFETEQQANAAILRDGQSLHNKPLKIAIKRDNIPASQRGGAFRGGGGYGMMRGGRGGGVPGYAPQQMVANAMMMMMGANMPFTPYGPGTGAPRGRGRGRGAGRGAQ